ncbi:MAG: hypothetical protein ACFB9M_05450 [Myxococcota bacterium]
MKHELLLAAAQGAAKRQTDSLFVEDLQLPLGERRPPEPEHQLATATTVGHPPLRGRPKAYWRLRSTTHRTPVLRGLPGPESRAASDIE